MKNIGLISERCDFCLEKYHEEKKCPEVKSPTALKATHVFLNNFHLQNGGGQLEKKSPFIIHACLKVRADNGSRLQCVVTKEYQIEQKRETPKTVEKHDAAPANWFRYSNGAQWNYIHLISKKTCELVKQKHRSNIRNIDNEFDLVCFGPARCQRNHP